LLALRKLFLFLFKLGIKHIIQHHKTNHITNVRIIAKDRRLRNKSKATIFGIVSERTINGKAAAEKVGVRPIPIWWSC
jgi:hypothetical protein